MRWRVAVIAGALVLAGCSSGGGNDYSSAADLAKAAGCSGYEKQEPEMYVQEEGSCIIDGQDVYVRTFADDAAQGNWTKVAKQMGASGFIGEGSKWNLTGDDRAAVEKGTKAAGGDVL